MGMDMARPMVECAQCSKPFVPYGRNPRERFCSSACRKTAAWMREPEQKRETARQRAAARQRALSRMAEMYPALYRRLYEAELD